jgi:hypothetical protein
MGRQHGNGAAAFYCWLVRRIQELEAKYPGNDAKGLEEARKLLDGAVSEGEEGKQRTGYGAAVVQAAAAHCLGCSPMSTSWSRSTVEIEQAMSLPYAEFQPVIEQLQKANC